MRRGSGLNTRSGSTRDGLADRIAFVKTYRPYSPEQSFLLPPSPRDWLPEGHLAIFVLDLVAIDATLNVFVRYANGTTTTVVAPSIAPVAAFKIVRASVSGAPR